MPYHEEGGNEGPAGSPDCLISANVILLARAHRSLAAELLRELGLFPGQEMLLLELGKQDGQSQQCLSQALQLDHSTVTKSLSRLECAGFIQRMRSEQDGRVTLVMLTEAGRALEGQVREIFRRLEEVTVSTLTADERRCFLEVTEKISRTLRRSLRSSGAHSPKSCDHD
ncbi:MarR family winged helix-turn-helix transcriptional regulator [Sulfobacillus sp. hq2]|uniref:MarR family winged helix-turn-helix transcriptional regulator n=1 Tax=Sulfobacillus TaxID=28033 RepID=UPI000CD2F4B0|nr:MarR family transcriptional regulator [Sulfobacillus sp. hq2]MCY0909761.1 MarR family transcriptional regulator [Sulfobacillus thermotolerans]POB10456.1 MarR family transcriptional regulator [Sulfobacillus sp. hq2]